MARLGWLKRVLIGLRQDPGSMSSVSVCQGLWGSSKVQAGFESLFITEIQHIVLQAGFIRGPRISLVCRNDPSTIHHYPPTFAVSPLVLVWFALKWRQRSQMVFPAIENTWNPVEWS